MGAWSTVTVSLSSTSWKVTRDAVDVAMLAL